MTQASNTKEKDWKILSLLRIWKVAKMHISMDLELQQESVSFSQGFPSSSTEGRKIRLPKILFSLVHSQLLPDFVYSIIIIIIEFLWMFRIKLSPSSRDYGAYQDQFLLKPLFFPPKSALGSVLVSWRNISWMGLG